MSEDEEPHTSDDEFIDDNEHESDEDADFVVCSYASGSETEDLPSDDELSDIEETNVVSSKRARRQTEFYADSDAEELLAESDDDGTSA